MSRVKNEPKIKNKLIVAIREQLEHRALWLYLLCDEAKKEGIDPTSFARKAISRCGHIHGRKLVRKGKTKSLKSLKKHYSQNLHKGYRKRGRYLCITLY